MIKNQCVRVLFLRKCPPGFSGNICERANNNNGVANVRVQSSVFTSACSSFPCRNNGLCQPAVGQPGGYTCICMANFYGVRCDYTKSISYSKSDILFRDIFTFNFSLFFRQLFTKETQVGYWASRWALCCRSCS